LKFLHKCAAIMKGTSNPPHQCPVRHDTGCAERLKLLYESERAGIPLITLHN
jgi:hypothetical protein